MRVVGAVRDSTGRAVGGGLLERAVVGVGGLALACTALSRTCCFAVGVGGERVSDTIEMAPRGCAMANLVELVRARQRVDSRNGWDVGEG